MTSPSKDTIRAHWKCFVACGIIVLSPFQYGLDFGLIGGLQAMPGFLKASGHSQGDPSHDGQVVILTSCQPRSMAMKTRELLSDGISQPPASSLFRL
jgi:hypothetical protein